MEQGVIILDKLRNYLQSINKKSFKYGSISVILTISVIATVILINLIINSLVSNNGISLKWDLSANKIYSLSDITINVLKNVDKDVEITALYGYGDIQKSPTFIQVKEVLSQYSKYSKHIKVNYIDPDKTPGIISELDKSGGNNLEKGNSVFKCGDKIRSITGDDIVEAEFDSETGEQTDMLFVGEQSFTGAIKYVLSEKTPMVYFTFGHGEASLNEVYTNLKKQLQANNYDAKTLNLLIKKKIPKDAELLIMPKPTVDILSFEKELLYEYLDKGGKIIFLFDSLESKNVFPNFESLFEIYNLGINYDKIKENDNTRHPQGDQFSVLLDAKANDIIKYSSQLLLTDSRSIRILSNEKKEMTITPLLTTSTKAEGVQIDKSRGNNINGPLNVAVAVENAGGTKPSKIILMGNAFFVTDDAEELYGYYYQYAKNFFTQALNWMIDKKDPVVIDAKSYLQKELTINDQQVMIIGIFTMVLLPLVILFTGLFVWIRRRHK